MAKYGIFETLEEVYAVALGLAHDEDGEISRYQFNRILRSAGLELLSNREITLAVQRTYASDELSDLYLEAIEGKLSESDLPTTVKTHVEQPPITEEQWNKVTDTLQEEDGRAPQDKDNTLEEVRKSASGDYTSARTLVLSDDELQDEGALLRYHNYDPEEWTIKTSSNVRSVRDTNQGEKHTYTSRVTVSPKVKPEVSVEEIVEVLRRRVEPVTVTRRNSGETHLTIPLFDLHFGISTYEQMRPKLQQIEEIIAKGHKSIHIIVGGDFQHSDVMNKSQTSNLTLLDPVDNDQALEDGHRFLSELIEVSLQNADEVKLHSIPGNHDFSKQYVLLWGMKFLYPQVEFNVTKKSRLAFGFGTVSFLVLHGDVAMKSAPMLYASEYPELWAKSTYRSVYSGHLHSERLVDAEGVVMHRFGTPKPSDDYEFKNGYTLARKHLQVQEFNESRLLATYEVE